MEILMRIVLLLLFSFGVLPVAVASIQHIFGGVPPLWNDPRLHRQLAIQAFLVLLGIVYHIFTKLTPVVSSACSSLDGDAVVPLAVLAFSAVYLAFVVTRKDVGWNDAGVATHFGSELVSPISAPPQEAPAPAVTFVPPPPPPPMTERPTIPDPPVRIPPPPTPTRAPALRVVQAYMPVTTEKPAVRAWRARVSGPQNPVRARPLSVVKAPAPVVAEMPTLPEPPARIPTPPIEPRARTLSVVEAPALIVAERPAVLEPPARIPSPPNLVRARAVSVVELPPVAIPEMPAVPAILVPPPVDIPAMPNPAPAPAPTIAVLPPFAPAGMQFAPVLDFVRPVAFPAPPQMPAAPAFRFEWPAPRNDMEIDDVGRIAVEALVDIRAPPQVAAAPIFAFGSRVAFGRMEIDEASVDVPAPPQQPAAPALGFEEPELHNDMEIGGAPVDIPALPQQFAAPAIGFEELEPRDDMEIEEVPVDIPVPPQPFAAPTPIVEEANEEEAIEERPELDDFGLPKLTGPTIISPFSTIRPPPQQPRYPSPEPQAPSPYANIQQPGQAYYTGAGPYYGNPSTAAYTPDMPWNEGETAMQRLMKVPEFDNPTVPALSPQLANHLQIAPLIAIGTLDKQGRPWTTLWGGEKGFARPLGGGIVGFRTAVTGRFDPVVGELVGQDATGEVVKEEGEGRIVSGLTIDLETRKRVKMCGRMVAGALSTREDEITGRNESVAEIQLVLKIEQSLGNCPKYLNRKRITPTFARPELVSDSSNLSERALQLLAKADLFFVSSSGKQDMDTNHRGGPPGFLRASTDATSVVWPEYSGNRLYQTLGNLYVNPLCGICVPDFDTGDMLYMTGTTEIFSGREANALLPRSNLCVQLTITAARFVAQALPFRGEEGQRSPYNPVVRYLASERRAPSAENEQLQQAVLLSQTKLTPTISRFRFSLENGATHKAGQYVTLDFSKHLDFGYSHMRNDDPRSLNDDFVRTFTVSSPPGSPPNPVRRLKDDEFEITARNVGVVTDFLFKHGGSEGSDRGGELEVGVKGFGGEFEVKQDEDQDVCFIAAGVGITPLLPYLGSIDLSRMKLVWTVRVEDVGLVLDMLAAHPSMAKSLMLFVTGVEDIDRKMELARQTGANVYNRRLQEDDVQSDRIKTYYVCTSVPMRKQLMEWLPMKELVFEDFNF
ncbi:hypothetical protein LTR17_004550 [Elasticomyces elasticus]|nr:hypothetical protein LTR17_004550 [Elasticomyces elasticus]